MVRQNWILILIVFMAFRQQIQAACVSKEKRLGSAIKRPRPKPKKILEFQLPPNEDICYCCSKITNPPAPIQFVNITTTPSPPCSTQPPLLRKKSQVNDQVRDNIMPADPISISLALQANKAKQVPEAKLAYGFITKPINALPKVCSSSIKEENLYALANDVITLKKPMISETHKMAENCLDLHEQVAEAENYEPHKLTYKQLGYEPEDFQNPTYISLHSSLINRIKYGSSECGCKPRCNAKKKCRNKYRFTYY